MLRGKVKVKGAKNAIGKLLMASLLTEEEVFLTNVPQNQETDIALEICRTLGSEIRHTGDVISIKTPEIKNNFITEFSHKNRIPILTLGALLARVGEGEVPAPGGDKIGARPVNFHVAALRKLGAEIEERESTIYGKASRLRGAEITLDYPSVGATENIIIASVTALGLTVIRNAAIEPEIIDLIKMLQKMGAIIELGANREIRIEGVSRLNGVVHELIPDRLEAASFAVMALATGGDVFVEGANQEHLITFLNTVRRLGGEYEVSETGIRFFRKGKLKPVTIETDTHPGFATDWQQPLMVLLTQAEGKSSIHETVYEDRFGYTKDLNEMGARIEVYEDCLGSLPCRFKDGHYRHSALVFGPTPLKSGKLVMRDIRAGMAHIIAALIADGESVITGIEHIDRGYEKIDERIAFLGANIRRVKESEK